MLLDDKKIEEHCQNLLNVKQEDDCKFKYSLDDTIKHNQNGNDIDLKVIEGRLLFGQARDLCSFYKKVCRKYAINGMDIIKKFNKDDNQDVPENKSVDEATEIESIKSGYMNAVFALLDTDNNEIMLKEFKTKLANSKILQIDGFDLDIGLLNKIDNETPNGIEDLFKNFTGFFLVKYHGLRIF